MQLEEFIIWAAPSEFVSSSIPSWQISTAHAQPFRGARDLAFCLKVPLDSLLVWASSEGSGETARMRRLAWTFAARIGDKYQIRLARPILKRFPRVTTPREDRLIRLTRLSNRYQTATSTSRTFFGGCVSEKTIRNRLRSNNLRAVWNLNTVILTPPLKPWHWRVTHSCQHPFCKLN